MKPQELTKPSLETSSEAFLERFLPGTSRAVTQQRNRIAQLNSPRNTALVNGILILGESGVGKNYMAKVLAAYRRWLEVRYSKTGNPGLDAGLDAFTDYFDEIHLPALPDALIESQLFGYKKGAFTDAREDRPGLLGGLGNSHRRDLKDLLLDEVGDASPALQSKLLQVVEERKFRPVGSTEYFDTSARLIMATNRDLAVLVKQGKFREDLFWRLNQFVVVVPPLRDQPENIEPIARSIESELRAFMPATEDFLSLSADDIAWARSYYWPGNVRELRYAIVRWLLDEGRVPLRQLVEHDAFQRSTSEGSPSSIAELVTERLDRAVRDNEALGSLMGLVKEFEREVKHAAHAWYRAHTPTEEVLQRLFPDGKPASVRNKLNTWKR